MNAFLPAEAAAGRVYQKSGLGELAAESYDEAQFLLTRDAK